MDSIHNQEMYATLCRFINKFKIENVSEHDINTFYTSEKNKRSIKRLDELNIVFICSFMNMRESIRFLLTCKSYIKYINDLWPIYEKMHHPKSTLSNDGVSVEYIKQNLALWEVGHIYHHCLNWRCCRDEIILVEERLKKLIEENKIIDEAKNPTLQSIANYKTNEKEIKSYIKEIKNIKEEDGGEEYIRFLKDFGWLWPDGYISNSPILDKRLGYYEDVVSDFEYGIEYEFFSPD